MRLRPLLLAAVALAMARAIVYPGEPPAVDQPVDGMRLYRAKCGFCHLEMGTGTIMLGWRLGKDKALLEKRTDLDAKYVAAIARTGLKSMPPLTRVEVTDGELQAIASYLAGPKSVAADSR
jgi:cytochrome c5